VEDLQSLNGVWQGSERVEKATLTMGAELRFGRVHAVVAIMENQTHVTSSRAAVLTDAEDVIVLNPRMRAIYDQVAQIAAHSAAVFVLGETGTGKEHIAQALHRLGNRRDKPFKVINCGAVPRELTESMLFGHEKGAFTGALSRHIGLFEQAAHGVLFLDEIGELSLPAQAALLRSIETKKITPLGSTRERSVDVRVVAATHCDIEAMVKEGSFRKDLFYRINLITLELPPLRERRDEIHALSKLFLRKSCESWGLWRADIRPAAVEKLEAYDWPGNIRELRNVIERCVINGRTGPIDIDELPSYIVEPTNSYCAPVKPATFSAEPFDTSYKEQLKKWEIIQITRAMLRSGGNQRAAAKLLRIPRRTLAYKLRSYQLHQLQREST
jgi:two-component system response regulator AtoC